jgi:hypothetical protein
VAVVVHCDATGCPVNAEGTITGWYQAEIMHYSTTDVPSPNSRIAIGAPFVFYFHQVACRDAWLTERGIPIPVESTLMAAMSVPRSAGAP